MNVEQTRQWYGSNDPVTLADIEQDGATETLDKMPVARNG